MLKFNIDAYSVILNNFVNLNCDNILNYLNLKFIITIFILPVSLLLQSGYSLLSNFFVFFYNSFIIQSIEIEFLYFYLIFVIFFILVLININNVYQKQFY